MQTILEAGYDYTMLVDFNYGGGEDLYRMDLVHLDPFPKPAAFDIQLCRINDKDIIIFNIEKVIKRKGDYLSPFFNFSM